MGMNDYARHLIKRHTSDFVALLRYFQKAAMTRQMSPVRGYIDNLIQPSPIRPHES